MVTLWSGVLELVVVPVGLPWWVCLTHTCFLTADEVLSCCHRIQLKQSGCTFTAGGVEEGGGDMKCKSSNIQGNFQLPGLAALYLWPKGGHWKGIQNNHLIWNVDPQHVRALSSCSRADFCSYHGFCSEQGATKGKVFDCVIVIKLKCPSAPEPLLQPLCARARVFRELSQP